MHTKKRTKIIATIGPSSEKEEVIRSLILEGVNVFRFNLKHNDLDWHVHNIKKVRNIANSLNTYVAILLDLQGPDVRIGQIIPDPLSLNIGDTVLLGSKIPKNTSKPFIFLNEEFTTKIKKNQEIILDDGNFLLKALSDAKEGLVECLVKEASGVLTSNKGVYLPNLDIKVPSLSPKDKESLKIAEKVNPEFLALSFVRNAQDVLELKNELNNKGLGEAKIVSKIETKLATQNIDSILEVSDGIMVARGDLGVEIHLEVVPAVQKMLIRKARRKNKFVIVATQMLKSMVSNPKPTRAEVSDVANACYDLADSVMLSEETAVGRYPLNAVKIMARTLKYNEIPSLKDNCLINSGSSFVSKSISEAIVVSANIVQKELENVVNPKAFLVLTESGKTAELLSSLRPSIPILSVSQKEYVARRLSLRWGVYPFSVNFKNTIDASINNIVNELKEKSILKVGDIIIVISGQNVGIPGKTDSLRVMITT